MDDFLNKKTTILFTPGLHAMLATLARTRQTSIGELVRAACVASYGEVHGETERVDAVKELSLLSLPVGTTARMKRESVASPKETAAGGRAGKGLRR